LHLARGSTLEKTKVEKGNPQFQTIRLRRGRKSKSSSSFSKDGEEGNGGVKTMRRVTCCCPNGHLIQPIGFRDIAPEYALRIARLLIGDLLQKHELLPWCFECGATMEDWFCALDVGEGERMAA